MSAVNKLEWSGPENDALAVLRAVAGPYPKVRAVIFTTSIDIYMCGNHTRSLPWPDHIKECNDDLRAYAEAQWLLMQDLTG